MSKVVLFENQKFLRDVYTQMFSNIGYDVLAFENSTLAFTAVRAEKPSVLVVSGEGGEVKDLITQVRKYPQVDVATTPILVVIEDKAKRTEYIDAGANRCLFKFPKSSKFLAQEVRNILNLPRLS